jgi:hypothetical protein
VRKIPAGSQGWVAVGIAVNGLGTVVGGVLAATLVAKWSISWIYHVDAALMILLAYLQAKAKGSASGS